MLSESLVMMYVSFAGILLLILALGLIWLSRQKLSGIIGGIVTFIAYICMIAGSIIILFVVLHGPTKV